MEKGQPRKPQPYTKNHGQLGNAESGQSRFLREEHTNWLSNTKRSALRVTLYDTINDNRGHEFERRYRTVFQRVWREKRKRETNEVTVS